VGRRRGRHRHRSPLVLGRDEVREDPIPDPSGVRRAALKRYKAAQARSLLAVGIAQSKDTAVVADAGGRAVPIRTFRDMFNAFCKEHGFALTFHALRHSNAIALLTSGVDVRTAAGRLGNSPALMLKTYSHFVRSADIPVVLKRT
jgi:integrase